MRLSLVTIPGIRALVVNLHHHTGTYRTPVRGEPITLGRDVPALTTAFADTGHDAGGATVDLVAAKVVAAGVCEVVGGGETCATSLRCCVSIAKRRFRLSLKGLYRICCLNDVLYSRRGKLVLRNTYSV